MRQIRSGIVPHWVAQAWNLIPAALAFALLLYQIRVPWSVSHFATEDGPSHVYGATVLCDLLAHPKTSVYSAVYTVQKKPLPNWTATVVLAVVRAIVGAEHAEQVFVTLAFPIGFLAWCYAARALSPGEIPWTPVANFLYQTWFLWIGFFNFYLGMALLPLTIALYVEKEGWLSARRAAVLAVALLALFATHLIAVAVALIALLAIGLWVHLVVPIVSGKNLRERWFPSSERRHQFGLILLTAAPAIVLSVLFAIRMRTPVTFEPKVSWAWHEFPMHIFLTAGAAATQPLLWKAMLIYAGLGTLLLKKSEWASAKGGLVFATVLVFAAYLAVPDAGLGGKEAKIRLSWAVFVLAGLVACSALRLRFLRVPAALFFAFFGFGNTAATRHTAAAVGKVVEDYLAVASRIAPRASVVRLRYSAPDLPARYGYEGIGRDPVFHLDALAAAANRCLDLTDYEALNRIFPVIYKSEIDPGQLAVLWGFEGAESEAGKELRWLDDNFPVPIDFVLVAGEIDSPGAVRMGMPNLIAFLDSTMRLTGISPGEFVRLYERRCGVARANPARVEGRACAH